MALLNIFRPIKPRKFEYIPRYYDPEKEERDRIIERARVDANKDMSAEAMKSRIQHGLRTGRGSYGVNPGLYRRKHEKRSNRLVIAIFVVLIVCAFYLLMVYGGNIVALYE